MTGFAIPNKPDVLGLGATLAQALAQAAPDKIDFAILAQAATQTGIVSGGLVSAQSQPDMTIAVGSGQSVVAGYAAAAIAAGNLTIAAAHASLGRLDLVVVDATGAKSVVAGTPAAEPFLPSVPANSIALAAIYVPAAATSLAPMHIVDKRMFVRPDLNTVDVVRDYGADFTGVANATALINAAAEAARVSGKKLTGTGTFRCDATVVIQCNHDLDGMTLNFTDTTINPALQVGSTSAYTRDMSGRLPKVVQQGKAGLGFGVWGTDVGVRFVNLKDSKIWGQPPQGFSVGFDVRGQGLGNVDNTYYGLHGDNCKIPVQLSRDATGWSNSNTYIGGHEGMNYGSEGSNISGARALLINDQCNNNVFIGMDLEGNGWEYNAEIYGQWNYLFFCRWETGSPVLPKVKFSQVDSTHYALGNVIYHGVASENIVFTEDAQTKGYNHAITRNRMRIGGSGSGSGNLVITNQSGGTNPAITILEALDGLSADASALYGLAMGMSYLQGKGRADTGFRWRISNATGRLDYSTGNGTITCSVLAPDTLNPENNKAANPGTIYARTNGELYFKQTGTGSTGWKRIDQLAIAESDVTGLVVDLAGKAPLGAGALRRTGALVETFPRMDATTNSLAVLVSGSLYMVAVEIGINTPCTSITFVSGATAFFPGGPSAHQFFGLYDASRNLLAASADDTNTAWAANAEKTLALVGGPITTTYSGLYYLGILVDAAGGTVPNLIARNPSTASAVLSQLPPALWGQTGVGLTALPNPASTFTDRPAIAYAYAS